MNKVPSFTINRNKLLHGIYANRQDVFGPEVITTFDIRMKELNREPVLHTGALHTIEHLVVACLRSNAQWKNKIIYWRSMGCPAGNCLIIYGDLKSSDIVDLVICTLSLIANYKGGIPGIQSKDCGNYLLHDLPMAKPEPYKFLEEVLLNIEDKSLIYPE